MSGALGIIYPLIMAALLGIGDGVLNTQLSALLGIFFKNDTVFDYTFSLILPLFKFLFFMKFRTTIVLIFSLFLLGNRKEHLHS